MREHPWFKSRRRPSPSFRNHMCSECQPQAQTNKVVSGSASSNTNISQVKHATPSALATASEWTSERVFQKLYKQLMLINFLQCLLLFMLLYLFESCFIVVKLVFWSVCLDWKTLWVCKHDLTFWYNAATLW